MVGFGTGECGNYVETTICQPLITILLQQQNKSPLLHRTQWVAVFFVRAFSWFTLRSLIIGNTHFLIHPIFRFWFLVTFDDKVTKILHSLCLHFARQDGQDGKKCKENYAIKGPFLYYVRNSKYFDIPPTNIT